MTNDLILLAGMLNVRGHFNINLHKNAKGKKCPRVQITLDKKEKEIIDWLYRTFGGNISCMDTRNGSNNYITIWRWEITGQKAIDIILAIKPYLFVKKDTIKKIEIYAGQHHKWWQPWKQ